MNKKKQHNNLEATICVRTIKNTLMMNLKPHQRGKALRLWISNGNIKRIAIPLKSSSLILACVLIRISYEFHHFNFLKKISFLSTFGISLVWRMSSVQLHLPSELFIDYYLCALVSILRRQSVCIPFVHQVTLFFFEIQWHRKMSQFIHSTNITTIQNDY